MPPRAACPRAAASWALAAAASDSAEASCCRSADLLIGDGGGAARRAGLADARRSAILGHLFFGGADFAAELFKLALQQLALALGIIHPRAHLAVHIGIGKGIGHARRRFRVARGKADVEHVGQLVARDIKLLEQLGRHRALQLIGGGHHAGGAADALGEFGILIEMQRFHHAARHIGGTDRAHLGFNRLGRQRHGVGQIGIVGGQRAAGGVQLHHGGGGVHRRDAQHQHHAQQEDTPATISRVSQRRCRTSRAVSTMSASVLSVAWVTSLIFM
jgi:hypothetical protein